MCRGESCTIGWDFRRGFNSVSWERTSKEVSCDYRLKFAPMGYQPLLAQMGIEVSMSRTANGDDNAAMESFFDTLTRECVNRMTFETYRQARSAIFAYLECFYNPVRLHSTLQSVSPLVSEQAFAPSMR